MLVGDILRDLPGVSNLTFSERAEYASPPVSPTQWYLRQGLSMAPDGAAVHEMRGKAAERYMQPTWAAYAARARSLKEEGGPIEVRICGGPAQT